MGWRIPWIEPAAAGAEWPTNATLEYELADPWGHVVAMVNERSQSALQVRAPTIDVTPAVLSNDELVCDDPVAIATKLVPELSVDPESKDKGWLSRVRILLDSAYALGEIDDQAAYEAAHAVFSNRIRGLDAALEQQRFLGGDAPDLADYLAFAFSIRHELVYYELFKASVGLLHDFPNLQAHARDMWERPEVWRTTDLEAIKAGHYRGWSHLNPSGFVPRGGIPDLDAPHFRAETFGHTSPSGVEEDQSRARGEGEWVRPASELRHWVRSDEDARFPAESGRYHLYAPYNCPWSHRVLLARAVKGLEGVVGASVVYFRRDPDNGWQFNPAIPGCTADLAEGYQYVRQHYEEAGSDERSVPILWDTEKKTIVNNESAEILRMFNSAFGELAERAIDLYPEGFRDEIDRINGAVYQRINNGAYKAGFAGSQAAYEHAFDRYFRAFDWLEELLGERTWLAGTDHPTEADLRLFPTVFRHDAVYFTRFKLNARKLQAYPRLADWLARIMDLPGVREASNLDHARNGYFGRTGNEIVPAGPVPLGLSRASFTDEVWLNE